jgi:hypothetical protein
VHVANGGSQGVVLARAVEDVQALVAGEGNAVAAKVSFDVLLATINSSQQNIEVGFDGQLQSTEHRCL